MPAFIFDEDSFVIDPVYESKNKVDIEWKDEFAKDKYKALLQLGFEGHDVADTPSMLFLQQLSEKFLSVLTALPELELARENVIVDLQDDDHEELAKALPFGLGTEFVNRAWIDKNIKNLNQKFSSEIKSYDGAVKLYLAEKSQSLRVPERVFFHLVEDNNNESYPFAFMATYATKTESGNVAHMPLKYALTEYKDEQDKLLGLLSCLNRAAEASMLIDGFVERGEMFHPLGLTSDEAFQLLKDIPAIEEAGIMCRIPNWWKKHSSLPQLTVSMGDDKASMLGFDTLISMQPKLMVDGQVLTKNDIETLLAQTEGLARLKGRWVEVDHAKLKTLLEDMEQYEGTVTLREALNIELEVQKDKIPDVGPLVTNGSWLGDLLSKLRNPDSIRSQAPPSTFDGELRAYQQTGFTWLSHMSKLGFGACLADDMGLGKTIQVLVFLEKLRKSKKNSHVLLIVPASLLGNWEKEAAKFVPKMDVHILHGRPTKVLEDELKSTSAFLTVTTYGMTVKLNELSERNWTHIIIDEAQAVKNPMSKQTKAVKKLKAENRIALTGTPIENDLSNLWSLFDFLNKGLLGTSKEFKNFTKKLDDHPEGYSKLKSMVSPFILRRVKTDKSIINDLPDKLEEIEYVNMSKKQIVLYRKQVSELEQKLMETTGIKRKGLVLSTIMRLKQICNHPSQFLGDNGYSPADSGKFQMLREICETVYEKRERILIFTQFKEIAEDLQNFLKGIFKSEGMVLTGATKIKERQGLVDRFNGTDYIPFMVLSVKAGGTGLNLTGANHVVHFDRWWNPAVENQATDRAYRIGQDKNVVVHKFVCKDTIEEKIDGMLNAKVELAANVLGSGSEKWITELGNDELLEMMRLDQ